MRMSMMRVMRQRRKRWEKKKVKVIILNKIICES